MTPEQLKIFLEHNDRATGEAINKYVNGKLDKITEKLDTHIVEHKAAMENLSPIIEAYKGTKVMGEVMKWISSVGLAAFGLWMAFKGLVK